MVDQITSQEDFFALMSDNQVVAIVSCRPGESEILPYEELSERLPFVKFAEVDFDKREDVLADFPVEPGCVTFVKNHMPAGPPVPAILPVVEGEAMQFAD